jgi:radical SAM protein with 4Fe4S-binding SPASM domain
MTPKDLDVGMINFTGLLYFPEVKQWYVEKFPEDLINEIRKRVGKGVFFRFEHCIDELNPPPHKCYAWMEPYIMMGGYVLPCCQVLMSNQREFLRQYAFGNVFEKDFKDIWDSSRYKKFRETIVNPKAAIPVLCAGCRGFNTKHRIAEYGVDKNV